MEEKSAHSRSCIAEHAAGYLAMLRGRKYSRRTVELYGRALEDFARFLDGRGLSRVQDVGGGDLERYRLELFGRPMQPSSVSVYLRALKLFFRHLESERLLLLNPADGVEPVREQRKLMPVPTEEEMRRLLAQPDTDTDIGVRDRALLETAYGTGARVRELCRLKVGDVDLKERTARLCGKGNKERMVPLGSSAAEWLEKYLAGARKRLMDANECPALWIRTRGGKLGYEGILHLVRHHVADAGLTGRVSPHAIRRACATHLLRHGAGPVEIQILLGHASLQSLSQYLKVTITDIRKMHRQSKPGA